MKNVGRSSAFRPRYPNIYYRTIQKDRKLRLPVFCCDYFSLVRTAALMMAVMGMDRIMPMLLEMPLMTSVAK